MRPIAEMSPRFKARIAGFMYLLIFITAPSGAATATPVKMFVNLACDTGVALVFYHLFGPVNRRLSFAASVFRLIFVVVMGVNSLNYFGATEFLQISHSSASFNQGLQRRLDSFRASLRSDGLSDCSIDIPSSDSRHADGAGGRGLPDLPMACAR